MVVDYEKAWVALKAEVVRKRSHGSRDLALLMAEIEVECRVPEGQEGFDGTPPAPRRTADTSSTPRPVGQAA